MTVRSWRWLGPIGVAACVIAAQDALALPAPPGAPRFDDTGVSLPWQERESAPAEPAPSAPSRDDAGGTERPPEEPGTDGPATSGAADAPIPASGASASAAGLLAATTVPRAPVRDDVGDSVSCGSVNGGALARPAELARAGTGYVIPEPWYTRGRRFGTDELVGLIERAAAAVDAAHPGGLLGVADLGAASGGRISGHASHQSGRDVDFLYYAVDQGGAPMAPDGHMPWYRSTGLATYAKAPEWSRHIAPRYFDVARNWTLVRSLLDDPHVDVMYIFVSHRVRRWLLAHAEEIGEPGELLARAEYTLRRPRNSSSHNDHMHVRIACPAGDRLAGLCEDDTRRRRRWWRGCPVTVPRIADAEAR